VTAEDRPTTPAERASHLADSIETVLNDGDVAAIEEYHAADLAYYRSSDEAEGRQGLKDDVRMFLSAFPDLTATVEEVFADETDPTVALRYRISGTHAGTFETIPPTGEEIDAQGIAIARYEDGEIAEFDLVFDNLGMLQDLGLIR
jgi:steroid delta-isomerase-like uncharacterized protein